MPYVRQEIRKEFDTDIDNLLGAILRYEVYHQSEHIDGIMNYIITRLINEVYNEDNYFILNRAKGVLTCASDEFTRRRIIPFEEEKKKVNGDVY